jgi:hypothetical protein
LRVSRLGAVVFQAELRQCEQVRVARVWLASFSAEADKCRLVVRGR